MPTAAIRSTSARTPSSPSRPGRRPLRPSRRAGRTRHLGLGGDPMNRPQRARPRLLTALAVLGAALVVLVTPAPAGAHGPDPVLGNSWFDQDQALTFDWRTGSAPPASVRAAVQAAAAAASGSRRSRAATFAYVDGGANPIGYGAGNTCGPNGIACFTRCGAGRLHDVAPGAGPPLRLGQPQVVPDLCRSARRLLRCRDHRTRRVRSRRGARPPRELQRRARLR